MFDVMDTMNADTGHTPHHETEDDRQARIARQAAGIAKARASAAAGRIVPSEAVDAWIDSLDTDHELPPPRSGQ
jgi:predicted transcriptional regulator